MAARTVGLDSHVQQSSQPSSMPVPDAFSTVLSDVDRVVAEGGDLGGEAAGLSFGQVVSSEVECQTGPVPDPVDSVEPPPDVLAVSCVGDAATENAAGGSSPVLQVDVSRGDVSSEAVPVTSDVEDSSGAENEEVGVGDF